MQGRSATLRPRPKLTRIVLEIRFTFFILEYLKLVVLFVVNLHNADFDVRRLEFQLLY